MFSIDEQENEYGPMILTLSGIERLLMFRFAKIKTSKLSLFESDFPMTISLLWFLKCGLFLFTRTLFNFVTPAHQPLFSSETVDGIVRLSIVE